MENHNGNPQTPDPLIRLWRHRKWVAIGVFCLVFIPGMVFLWALPPIYEATATLTVPGAGAAIQAGDGPAYDTPLAAVTERVLSRDNLSRIGTELNVSPKERGEESAAKLTGSIRHNITVEAQRTKGPGWQDHLYAFTVTYRNWRPQTAAAVTNWLAKSYQSTAAEMQASQAKQTAEALAARIAAVGKKLDAQRERINEYRKQHLGGLPQQQQVLLTRISRLDSHLQAVESQKIAVMKRRDELLDQAAKSGGGSLAELRQQLEKLRTIYTDQYPEVKQLKQRIAALEMQKRLEAAGVTDPPAPSELGQVNAQLRSLRREENSTREKIDQFQQQLNMLPVTSQKIQALSQGYNATSGVYSALLTSYEHARVAAATVGTTRTPYHILEAATAAGGPVGPKRLRFAVMLLILSLGIGVAAAYIADKQDTTFHSLEELKAFTSVPILATVPYIDDEKWHPWEALRSKVATSMLIAGVCLLSIAAYVVANGSQAITLALSSQGG